MWMTIQQYADKQGISYQGAYKAFKKYGADLMTEGHVKEDGRTTMIDGYAADFLASKRRPKGSSLARSVEYEAMAKKAIKKEIPETFQSSSPLSIHHDTKAKKIRNDSKKDEISALQLSIDKLRKQIDDDMQEIQAINQRIMINIKSISSMESRINKLYQDLLDKQDKRDINEMVMLLKKSERDSIKKDRK